MIRHLFSVNYILKSFKLKNVLNFSSVAERISDNDPKNHQINHVGKFYKISDEDFGSIFEYQLKNDFSRLLKVFRDKSILVRKEAVEVIEFMRNTDYSLPIVRYVIYGREGTGKTVGMAHISHAAVSQGDWLLIHFPDLYNMLHFSPELSINSKDENIFDIPTMASNWLKAFMIINAKFLDKHRPKLLKHIHWNQKESLAEGTLWTEMINFAVSRPKYSSDCVGILLREAREHAVLRDFKVLGLIRGINCLWTMSKRHDANRQKICPTRISVLKYLKRFIRNDWNNGAIVSSVNYDTIYNPDPSITYYSRSLLGDQGFKDLDPFVPIEFLNYTKEEVANYLDFLDENHYLTISSAKDKDGIGRREIAFLSDNRPLELFKVTMEW